MAQYLDGNVMSEKVCTSDRCSSSVARVTVRLCMLVSTYSICVLVSSVTVHPCFGCASCSDERQDLRRSAVERADAVFIFANKFADNQDVEDAKNIVRALAIKR